jgi:hypothetical protein
VPRGAKSGGGSPISQIAKQQPPAECSCLGAELLDGGDQLGAVGVEGDEGRLVAGAVAMGPSNERRPRRARPRVAGSCAG